MTLACAWHKMMHPKKSTTWPVRIVKDFIKEDLQDTIRGEISLKITTKVGDPTLGITSTEIKEFHLIILSIKDLICMREPPS